MAILQGVYAAVFLLCLIILLWVSQKRRQRYALAKGIQSALFVGGALLAWFSGNRLAPQSFPLMLTALILCAFGDIALGFANQARHKASATHKDASSAVGTAGVRKVPFLAGAGAFLAAHVVFCIFYFRVNPFHPLCLILPAACVALIMSFEGFGLIRMGKLKFLGIIYPFLVGLMTSAALSAAIAVGASSVFSIITAIGSLLFLLSDTVLVFLYFGVKKHSFYRWANLTTYYLGIFLLAASCRWLLQFP